MIHSPFKVCSELTLAFAVRKSPFVVIHKLRNDQVHFEPGDILCGDVHSIAREFDFPDLVAKVGSIDNNL